jgi:hypothetical protein
MLLATSALASAALPTAVARATDATWLEAPANSNFNDGANWGFETPPRWDRDRDVQCKQPTGYHIHDVNHYRRHDGDVGCGRL